MGITTMDRCRHCRYHPASPRIFGYCSWDCHDADGEDEREADRDAEEQPAAA